MSRAPSRFITLEPEQHDYLLKKLGQPDTCGLERRRITVLLMSHTGNSMGQIEKTKLLTRKSVARLFDLFEEKGVESVDERDHPGPISKVTREMRAWIYEQVTNAVEICNASTLSESLEKKFEIYIRPNTLLLHLHDMNISWQRTRYIVSGTPDPEYHSQVSEGLPTLKRGL